MPEGDILRIEPGAAERIARAFDSHADNLALVAERLKNAGHLTGFAGFPSAVELDEGFTRKARAAVAHLQSQIETARQAADRLRAAGAAYSETDTTNSRSIHTTGEAIISGNGHQ